MKPSYFYKLILITTTLLFSNILFSQSEKIKISHKPLVEFGDSLKVEVELFDCTPKFFVASVYSLDQKETIILTPPKIINNKASFYINTSDCVPGETGIGIVLQTLKDKDTTFTEVSMFRIISNEKAEQKIIELKKEKTKAFFAKSACQLNFDYIIKNNYHVLEVLVNNCDEDGMLVYSFNKDFKYETRELKLNNENKAYIEKFIPAGDTCFFKFIGQGYEVKDKYVFKEVELTKNDSTTHFIGLPDTVSLKDEVMVRIHNGLDLKDAENIIVTCYGCSLSKRGDTDYLLKFSGGKRFTISVLYYTENGEKTTVLTKEVFIKD